MERLLEKAGVAVPLGGRALEMLIVLVEHTGEIVSKRDLIEQVWTDVTVDEGILATLSGSEPSLPEQLLSRSLEIAQSQSTLFW